MLVRVGSAIDPQLRVVWAPSALGEGTGLLSASHDAVSFVGPGDTAAGTAVTVIDGGREKVFAHDSTTKFVVVERSGDEDLDCTAVPLVFDTRKDPHEQLADVDAAIARVLVALSASAGDERIQRESLKELRAHKAELIRSINRTDGTAPIAMTPDFSASAGGAE